MEGSGLCMECRNKRDGILHNGEEKRGGVEGRRL